MTTSINLHTVSLCMNVKLDATRTHISMHEVENSSLILSLVSNNLYSDVVSTSPDFDYNQVIKVTGSRSGLVSFIQDYYTTPEERDVNIKLIRPIALSTIELEMAIDIDPVTHKFTETVDGESYDDMLAGYGIKYIVTDLHGVNGNPDVQFIAPYNALVAYINTYYANGDEAYTISQITGYEPPVSAQ